MPSLLLLLALLSFAHGTSQNAQADLPMLYAENGAKYSFRAGVLDLQGGRGWLRTPKAYLDFVLALEFRLTTPDTDTGILVRSWTGEDGRPDRRYRIRLPAVPEPDVPSILEARDQQVTVARRGTIVTRPSDEWQSVEVSAVGKEVTVTLNSVVAGVFEIESFGGHILLEARKGRIELRNIRIEDRWVTYEGGSVGLITMGQLEKAGGEVPRVAREVKPIYPPAAYGRGVQGVISLTAIVLEDGSVGPVGVVRSNDRDLALSAIAALRMWKFRPGTLNGKRVPVLVEVDLSFTIKK